MLAIEQFNVYIINSSNQEIQLIGNNPLSYGLIAIDGIEATAYKQNINANGNLPGGTLTGTKIEPRQIDIDFAILKGASENQNRLFLESFFSPLDTLDVVVERAGTKRHIFAKVSSFNIEQSDMGKIQLCSLSLICPQPFFLNMSNYGKDIAFVTPRFTPPFLMPLAQGQVMGIINPTNETIITNDGDMAVGFTAKFVAKAAVSNPKIYNARTGEFVRVIQDMVPNDVLIISMMDGNKTITLNGVSITNKLDRDSKFFKIAQGANVIGYEADSGQLSLSVYLSYTPVYFGI